MSKKPPSRVRYEQSHPVVSARLDTDTHQKLKEMLKSEGKSLAQLLREIIHKGHMGHKGAYEFGYNAAVKEWQVWYYCVVCGKRIDIKPNGESHKEIIRYLKRAGWGHAECHENRW